MDVPEKKWCLEQALEVTKEYARGGGQLRPQTVLSETYEKLKELGKDAWS